MNRRLFEILASIILLFLTILPVACFSQIKSSNKDIISAAQKVVKKYHSNANKTKNVVKVVYFQGRDRQPLANWNERLDRTLTAVSDFYKEEFKRYGIESEGVNFEKSGGKYVITVVQGDYDAKTYNQNSGAQIESEIFKKAGGKIDFSNDHVLILTGLSYVREDGIYVFHSPYYGRGSSQAGICYAADSEMLDPKYLTDKTTRMRFSEPAIMFKDCLVAEFNSWYIGGIAHEMGHMLGLHHDFGDPDELTGSTISLMGEYGSRHFRDYLWGGQQTAQLSAAGVLQLLSSPVFTNSRKEISSYFPLSFSDLKIEVGDSAILLKALIGGNTVPYAVSVLIHSANVDEYRNESSIYPVSAMGPISIRLKKRPVGNYRVTFLFMSPNGAVQPFFKFLRVNAYGVELMDVPGMGPLDIKAYYTRLSKDEKTADIKQKLQILERIINPAPPVAAGSFAGDSLYLSDAKWEAAAVGWEKPARDYFSTEREETFFLQNQNEIFERGMFAHSPSVYTVHLNKKWKRFSAIVGIRDGAHEEGSARFTLIGDGKVLYTSTILRVGERANVNIDIENIDVIMLKAEGTEGHNHNSWAMWLNPLLAR